MKMNAQKDKSNSQNLYQGQNFPGWSISYETVVIDFFNEYGFKQINFCDNGIVARVLFKR